MGKSSYSGTVTKAGSAAKSCSTSGVKHGPSNPNGGMSSKPKGVQGSGMSSGRMAPIKGKDRGGL